ncbi:MAG TPA: hypothetical protein HA257_06180 [Candidatus Methanoperedenaceae archaeon]|nr:hypothetical protein [Candidatus Methanoperedenaceae archaeon]
MEPETGDITPHVIKTMKGHLSTRGLRVSQRKLMDTILEFLTENESEILYRIKEKKNYEMKLKKWVESPVEAERTDAVEEHDLVV